MRLRSTAAGVILFAAASVSPVRAVPRVAGVPLKAAMTGTSGRIVLPDAPQSLLSSPQALAGIKVYPVQTGFGRSVSAKDVAITDSEGHYQFSAKWPDKTLLLIVPPPSLGATPLSGIQPNRYASVTFARVRENGPNIFKLASATRLSTKFVDHRDKPLSNRDVCFWPAEDYVSIPSATPAGVTTAVDSAFPLVPTEIKRLLTARTNADGRCEIAGMAQNVRYSVLVDAAPGRYAPPVLSRTLLTKTSPSSDIPLYRIALNGIITGRATWRRTGKPVSGAIIKLQEPGVRSGFGGVITTTDRNGRYTFTGLYPGSFHVSADVPSRLSRAGNWQFQRYMTNPTYGSEIPLYSDESAVKKDFQIVEVANVIVHLHDRDGRPIYGQDVLIEETNGNGFGKITGIDGTVRLPGQPGWMRVRWDRNIERRRVSSTQQGRLKNENKEITIREGETRHVFFGSHVRGRKQQAALAPNFTAFDTTGKKVRLSDYRGSVVVLDLLPPPAPGEPSRAFTENFDFLSLLTITDRVLERLQGRSVISLALVQARPGSDPRISRRFRLSVEAQKSSLLRVHFLREATEYFSPSWPQRLVIGRDGTIHHHYSESSPGYLAVFKDDARLERAVREALKN